MLKYLIAAALAATLAAPAEAEDASHRRFDGFHIEGMLGTDNDLFYGGALGYDWRRGGMVFGVEGEADLADAKACVTLDLRINDRLCQQQRRDLYAGGRAGIVIGPGTLLYAKAGYTNLRLGVTYDGGSGGGGFDLHDALDGVRVGLGIEQRLGQRVFVKGEYRYSNYEQGSYKNDLAVGIGVRF